MEVFQANPLASLISLNYFGVLSYLLKFLAWGFGLPSSLYQSDANQHRNQFLAISVELFWDIRISVSNPTISCLAFEFLFSLTSREGDLGQGVREKVNSFSIVEISLSLEFSV